MHHYRDKWLQTCLKYLLLLIAFSFVPSHADELPYHDLDATNSGPIGNNLHYFVETNGSLSLQDILQQGSKLGFTDSQQQVLTFGIGASPVWVRLAVQNFQHTNITRRLIIDVPWLDDIQVYVQHSQLGTIKQFHTGDSHPLSSRPIINRSFHFDLDLPPGKSSIYAKIATPDPMVVPVYLLDKPELEERELLYQYAYGFGYGVLIALLVYNLMLFIGLKEYRYFLYVLYLSTFTVLNITYTGHGFFWLWPEAVFWQQWSHPLLITMFAMSGLIFALYFLDTKLYAKRLFYAVYSFIVVVAALFFISYLIQQQTMAIWWSFLCLGIYLVFMLLLGAVGLKHGQPSARYFLLAMVSGLIGVAITMFSVLGFLPFNDWTFNAAEIGMLVEAGLLAFALSYRFRSVERQKLEAEEMALIDSLTEINNRRSFYQKTSTIWELSQRHDRALSVIMFDIDNFKNINDQFGHLGGDRVLKETGQMISKMVRSTDIAARWGGEEFILLLAETGIEDANAFAERLRSELNKLQVAVGDNVIRCSASFGVAEKQKMETSIDTLIEKADKALYEAKVNGKDQVVNAHFDFA